MRSPLVPALLVLVLALSAGPGAAQTGQGQGSRPAPLDRAGVLVLTRQSLTALDQANRTGNYTVLRDLGGPGFQGNTAARLAEVFASLRREGVDLAPALVLEPVLTSGPALDANGLLRMTGYFPSNPRQLNFEVAYQAIGGEWRLYGLSVATSTPAPTPAMPKPPGEPAGR